MFEALITKHSPLFWRSFRIIKDALNHLDEYYPIYFGVKPFFKLSFIIIIIFLLLSFFLSAKNELSLKKMSSKLEVQGQMYCP